MVLKQFPDLQFVRQLRNDATTGYSAWKNVAINLQCNQTSRTGIEGPYSLFINTRGHSHCRIEGNHYRIETDSFVFSQAGQEYDLLIDNTEPTEIFNVHINKQFFEDSLRALTNTSGALLENAVSDPHLSFYTQHYPKSNVFGSLIQQLATAGTDSASFEEGLQEIILYIALANKEIANKIAKLPFANAAVKADIHSRLALARDYMYACYNRKVSLDEISQEIGMSKFHFLRMFKSFYGAAPSKFLQRIRVQKAANFLRNTEMSVDEIAGKVGFEFTNSFIKVFREYYLTTPQTYRLHK